MRRKRAGSRERTRDMAVNEDICCQYNSGCTLYVCMWVCVFVCFVGVLLWEYICLCALIRVYVFGRARERNCVHMCDAAVGTGLYTCYVCVLVCVKSAERY